jgi:DNA-binding transcriptional regulator YiaG
LAAMARRLGVVQATLCRWESGERDPQGEYLVRVTHLLQADGDLPDESSPED